MNQRLIALTATWLGLTATLAAGQDKPAPFRVAVDVVAVDVQVIDKNGHPVPDLGPEKFSVTINGRRRRILSAERIGSEGGDRSIAAAKPSAAAPGRVIVIAVDCVSFDATASRGVIQAVRQFVRQLSPDDSVGLSAYPNGPKLNPTTDHAAVLRALDTVVGQRDLAEVTQFPVRPSEIVDITRELTRGGGPTVDAVLARECSSEPTCSQRLITDVTNTALYYEGQATASLGMLRTLVEDMRSLLGRKTLVLISGGMIASDTPGGRPDLSELGIRVGKEAALANTTIYTLYVDTGYFERFSAQTRLGDKSQVNWSRDNVMLGRWLEQFSGAAGGALFTVPVGNAEQALARISTELKSVLPPRRRAGRRRPRRPHARNHREDHAAERLDPRPAMGHGPEADGRWQRDDRDRGADSDKGGGPGASRCRRHPAPPPRPVVPPEVQTLADVYDRGNYDALQRAMPRSAELANTIRAFRMSVSPWPNDPKRTAVFALEVALAGLRSDNTFAREEGGRLLAEYHTRVRQPSGADAFECLWFLTESAALEGLFLPDSALLFIPRALQRCPTSPRLRLAYAFVSEQQWLRGGLTPDQELEVVQRYEEAMKFPETEPEARVRAARFLYGLGTFDRALAVLDGGTAPSTDKEVQYFSQLIRGQILRALGRSDDAVAAFRAALATWPGAQSARVALMTLHVNRGEREEAAKLAEATQTASENEFDPWWTYWLGDFRTYPAMLDKLRELGR